MGKPLEFSIKLSGHAGIQPPAMALVVDTDQSGTLSNDTFVRLDREDDEFVWTGECAVVTDYTLGTLFALAVRGTKGKEVEVTVKSGSKVVHGPDKFTIQLAPYDTRYFRVTS